MDNKKKYLAIITGFSSLDGYLHIHDLFIEKLSKNFEKIFIINHQNLKFFPKIARSVYYEKENNEFLGEVSKLPKNFELFDPKDSKDFSKFLEDKKILVINNFGRHFFALKIYLLLKKYKIQQIQIRNTGHIPSDQIFKLKHVVKNLVFLLNQILFNKITVLLSNMGIIPKLEIIFISNKKRIEDIQNNIFKRLLYKYKLLFSKEIILVNSKVYDVLIDKKIPVSEDYIVHLDASLNHRHQLELRGKLNEEIIAKHYYYLERILKRLSQKFNKEVIVCIHPYYDIKEHQRYFKDFKVLQFRTRECIYKSFLVTNFNSSAVLDALLLKKKIIGFVSNFMSRNEIQHSEDYPDRVGYLKLNTQKDYLFDKDEILVKINKNLSNYEKYNSNYHCFEPNKLGTDKIIKIIKERFFNSQNV